MPHRGPVKEGVGRFGIDLRPAPLLSQDDNQLVVEQDGVFKGCRFQNRCPRKLGGICETETPPVHSLPGGHRIACHIAPEAA